VVKVSASASPLRRVSVGHVWVAELCARAAASGIALEVGGNGLRRGGVRLHHLLLILEHGLAPA